MPENLAIGAFVLGSVLLLVSLVSGGFKIFGAEVSGTTGRIGRAIAFVLGLVFIITGFSIGSAPSKVNLESTPSSDSRPTPSDRPPSSSVTTPVDTVPAGRPSNRRSVELVDSGIKTGPASEPAQESVRSLDISWRDGTPELQQIVLQSSPQERAVLGMAVMSTGMDFYAFRVKITNTGDEPVSISPAKLRVHFGLEAVPATTIANRQFLRPVRLQPNQSSEGLIAFSARVDIGAQIRLGGGNLSYEDDSLEISYNGQ